MNKQELMDWAQSLPDQVDAKPLSIAEHIEFHLGWEPSCEPDEPDAPVPRGSTTTTEISVSLKFVGEVSSELKCAWFPLELAPVRGSAT